MTLLISVSVTKHAAGETLRWAVLRTKPPPPKDAVACFQIHLIFLKVNSHAWLRDMCMQLCFCLLMSLKALIGNWYIYLLLKAIFFLMPIGWGLRQAELYH